MAPVVPTVCRPAGPTLAEPLSGQMITRAVRFVSSRGPRSLLLVSIAATALCAPPADRTWLAGDSHIHSHWSSGYDRSRVPPTPLKGQDAAYSTPRNAAMARKFGLRWMVTTDHGGPNHAKLNLVYAHRELTLSRELVPEVLQFYGMELNMPSMDHHTLIIPNAEDEASVLYEIEGQFDANEDWALPPNPRRRSESARIAALTHLQTLARLPLLFANHPSRSATGIGVYGLDAPRELRANHDLAPEIYHGMSGAPGHQAATLAPDGGRRPDRPGQRPNARGGYGNPDAPTLGGFDQMTAIVGGLWDSLLGEGRRFWIVAGSDSHFHYTDPVRPGSDFWPGEFHKTYVLARPTYEDVLDGLRSGRIFAAAGGLITTLDVTVDDGTREAGIGGTLAVTADSSIAVTIQFTDPDEANAGGDDPAVQRVDLIVGEVQGPAADPDLDRNLTTQVIERFGPGDWARDGDRFTVTTVLPAAGVPRYLRVRGTSTTDLEPLPDGPGENPWRDLWFYSNPTFIEIE